MRQALVSILHAIANTADNLASKLATNEPEPLLDYAGIVHYGSFTFHDYYAEATPNGTYHVWHHNEYLGEHRLPIDLNETTITTHKKEQK